VESGELPVLEKGRRVFALSVLALHHHLSQRERQGALTRAANFLKIFEKHKIIIDFR